MNSPWKCVGCKKDVPPETFGIFIKFEFDNPIDLGTSVPFLEKHDEGLIQVKICEECKNKNCLVINPFEERKKLLEEITINPPKSA